MCMRACTKVTRPDLTPGKGQSDRNRLVCSSKGTIAASIAQQRIDLFGF